MVSRLKVTDLDFDVIKANLKEFLNQFGRMPLRMWFLKEICVSVPQSSEIILWVIQSLII